MKTATESDITRVLMKGRCRIAHITAKTPAPYVDGIHKRVAISAYKNIRAPSTFRLSYCVSSG